MGNSLPFPKTPEEIKALDALWEQLRHDAEVLKWYKLKKFRVQLKKPENGNEDGK